MYYKPFIMDVLYGNASPVNMHQLLGCLLIFLGL